MKISNIYIQEEKSKQYNYRFEFKDITNNQFPSFMLYRAPYNKVVSSMLDNLHEYNSLSKVKPYENTRS